MVGGLCNRTICCLLCVLTLACLRAGETKASDSSPQLLQVGYLKEKKGTVVIRYSGAGQSQPILLASPIHIGDTLETGADGQACFRWYGPQEGQKCPEFSRFACDVSLGRNSRVTVTRFDQQGPAPAFSCSVDLGIVRLGEKKPRIKEVCSRVVVTPMALIEVLPSKRAVHFTVEILQNSTPCTVVTVISGRVKVRPLSEDSSHEKVLGAAQALTVGRDTKPFAVQKVSQETLGQLIGLTTISESAPSTIPGSSTITMLGGARSYPTFRWPPPRASVVKEVPAELLKVKEGPTLLKDVDRRISEALSSSGYFDSRYWAVPDGFALVTRMEQIESDGSPKQGLERWTLDIRPVRFNLRDYLKALFTGRPGYYRIIVFIVTCHDVVESDAKVTEKWAKAWLKRGLNKLPPPLGALQFSTHYACTALIYEFERYHEANRIEVRCPGQIPARNHLVKAGIWGALQARSR